MELLVNVTSLDNPLDLVIEIMQNENDIIFRIVDSYLKLWKYKKFKYLLELNKKDFYYIL
jgi:hypothetical protein